MPVRALVSVLTLLSSAAPAVAAEALDGTSFGLAWTLPFVGILLSIALFPLLASHLWEHHQGKIAAFWALAVILPLTVSHGPVAATDAVLHTARARVHALHPPAARPLHHRERHRGRGQHPWLAGHEHGAARHRDRAREPDRHDRRLHGDDPAHHSGQRRPAPQRPCRRVLHLPGLERRRLADPARRPAPVPRLPARRRFLLDDDAPVRGDAVRRRPRCSAPSSSSTRFIYRKEEPPPPKDPTPDKKVAPAAGS